MENQFQVSFEVTKTKGRKPSMVWHDGILILNGVEYPFTLCEMYESNTGTSSYEVSWVEGTPENSEELEKMIEDKFDELD